MGLNNLLFVCNIHVAITNRKKKLCFQIKLNKNLVQNNIVGNEINKRNKTVSNKIKPCNYDLRQLD